MKVLVGLSGGVDSAVSAKLLLDQGHEVSGVTMRLFKDSKKHEQDIVEARQVADSLNIDHRVYDFSVEFKQHIMDYFVESYKKGETPNPCYVCNKQIKFGLLLDRALEEGFDAVATGHYAKVVYDSDGNPRLARGLDRNKDQSYFLALLNRFQLEHILFPLSDFVKDETRSLAQKWNLPTASKRESQDICFVSKGDYVKTIEQLNGDTLPQGKFIDMTGKTVGTHRGLHRYTIGQRRGLALAFGSPVYVVEKNAQTNTVRIGTREQLACKGFIAHSLNLVKKINEPTEMLCKTRYRQKEKAVRITAEGDDSLRIEYLEPEYAVAIGQAAVFYEGETVFGGGIIAEVF